jgi:hypothetical protein
MRATFGVVVRQHAHERNGSGTCRERSPRRCNERGIGEQIGSRPRFPGRRRPAGKALNAYQQLAEVDRLREEFVGSHRQPRHPIVERVPRGEK